MAPANPPILAGPSAQTKAVLAWIAVGLGQAAFIAVHVFEYLGVLAVEVDAAVHHDHSHHDHDHLADIAAMHEPAMMWMIVAWNAMVLAPIVVALIARRAAGVWTAFGLGVLGALLGVLDGIAHAINDESVVSLAAAVILVGIPGALAAVFTWRWARALKAGA